MAFSVVLVAFCTMTSCKDDDVPDVAWPEWPVVSAPEVVTATLKPAAGSGAEIVAGSSVRFRAHITDSDNEVRRATLTVTVGGNEIVSEQFRLTGGDADVEHTFTVPFVSGMDGDVYPAVTLDVVNSLHKTASVTLSEAQNVLVKRPVLGDEVYLVTSGGDVYELPRSVDNRYSAEVKAPYFESYKIAAKLTADRKIDYSSIVWGLVDGQVAVVTDASAAGIPSDVNPAAIIKKMNFDAVSFRTVLDLAVVFGGAELQPSSYNGYQEATLSLASGQTYTVTGIGGLATAVDPNFFESVSDSEVKFVGLDGEYTLYYNLSKSRLYIEQRGATYPAALWISGMGLGFPQPPYSLDVDWSGNGWNWTVDVHQRSFCKKTGDGVFEALLYISRSINLKIFQQCGWGGEFQSYNFTTSPENILVDGIEPSDGHKTGDFATGPAFTEGVYLLRLDFNRMTIEIIRR